MSCAVLMSLLRAPAVAAVTVLALVIVAGGGLGACGGACPDSADVRLTLEGNPDAMVGAEQLEIGILVGQGTRQVQRVTLVGALTPGRALLLHPTETPLGENYQLSVDVTAQRLDGSPLARGQVQASLLTRGCNQLALQLVGAADSDLGAADLLSTDAAADLAGADLAPMDLGPDLAPCVDTTPDEDGDGRGDRCDICAANADPTITDGDGDKVPDICDPAAETANNMRVYFEGFNGAAVPAGWVQSTGTTFTVTGAGEAQVSGSMAALTNTHLVAVDPNAPLPGGVWMQTYATLTALTAGNDAGLRIYLWTTVGSAGYYCEAETQGMGMPNILRIREYGGGATTTSLGPSGNLAIGQQARFRMWVRGTELGCELARANGSSPVTVTRTLAAAPAGPLRPGVGAGFQNYSVGGSVTARYTSIFAVSYP